MLGKKCPREHLIRHLASQFVLFVTGEWDGLARKEPEAVSRRWIGRALIQETARIVVAAGLPVLGLVLIQRSAWALTGTAAATATLIVAVFAFVVILSTFVPEFDTYVEKTKNVLSLMTFGRRE